MNLEEIGFYTLSEHRAQTVSSTSPLMRAEMILTDTCNLKCLYCRGLKHEYTGEISLFNAKKTLKIWGNNKVWAIRFSGGEPTIYPYLLELVQYSKHLGAQHIAISTNGTADISEYEKLIEAGVNDFSVSLDAGCCSIGTIMTGGNNAAWNTASDTIRYLSQKGQYVTVGAVFNEVNVSYAKEAITYIDSLHPSDIRIIPSAQYNKAIQGINSIEQIIIDKYPILKYRVHNFRQQKQFRGLTETDCQKCYLVLDDVAVVQNYHFPCIIYLREQGQPIGKMNEQFRQDRVAWFQKHDSYKDPICKRNCLDVCIQHNNRCHNYASKNL